MYCKKCKLLLEPDNTVCSHCGFNNENEFIEQNNLEKIRPNIEQKKQKRNNKNIIFFLFLVVVLTVFSLTFIEHTKSVQEVQDTNATIPQEHSKTFEWHNLTLSYPETFGSSKNTIFYKNNTAINIQFKTLSPDEYTNSINGNECLDSKIGNIATKTYAEELSYSHLFSHEKEYYQITINYNNDKNIYTESIQLEITKILNSITKKNQ